MNLKHQFMIRELMKLKIKLNNGPDFNDKMVCECWIEEIDNLSREQFVEAIQIALMKCEFFPSTAKFKSFVIKPEATIEEKAIEVTDRIVGCLSSCGYTNPDKAKEIIGELGWTFILRMGGWKQLCDSVTDCDQLPALKAQWRNSIVGIHNQALRGDNGPPSLPKARNEGLTAAKDMFKLILGEMK